MKKSGRGVTAPSKLGAAVVLLILSGLAAAGPSEAVTCQRACGIANDDCLAGCPPEGTAEGNYCIQGCSDQYSDCLALCG